MDNNSNSNNATEIEIEKVSEKIDAQNDRMKKIQGQSFFYEQNQKSHYRTYTKENGYMINYFNNKYGTKYSGYGELEYNDNKKIMKTNVEIYLKNIVKQSYISVLIFFRGLNENYNITKKNLFQNFVFDIMHRAPRTFPAERHES